MHFIRRYDTLSPNIFKIFINDLTDILMKYVMEFLWEI